MTSRDRSSLLTLLLLASTPKQSQALNLEEFLNIVQKNHSVFQSVKISKEAASERRSIGDLVLSPYLTAKAGHIDDQKEQAVPASQGTRTLSTDYSLGVAKKFSSGTTLSLGYAQQKLDIRGVKIPDLTSPTGTKDLPIGYTGSWTLYASQSLWKDGFGQQTRLRHQRESKTETLEKMAAELQARQILIQAEHIYWDLSYQQEDKKIREESLERATKLLAWAKKRLANGIANDSDLLQIQALVSSRQLQLTSSEDELKSAQKKLADLAYPQILSEEVLPNFNSEVGGYSQYKNKKNQDNVLRIDSVLAKLETQMKQTASLEFKENLKPDLLLETSLATNSRKDSWSSAASKTFSTSKPTTYIGLRFSMDLDFDGKSSAKRALGLDAQAADLKSERLKYDAKSMWSEITRRHDELNKRIQTATQLSQIQKEKFKKEQIRLQNGRSTTFQVVTFEQEAAESDLILLKLEIEKRKLESQAYLYLSSNELPNFDSESAQ